MIMYNLEEWEYVPGYKGILKAHRSGLIKKVAHFVKDENGKMKIVKEHIYSYKEIKSKGLVLQYEDEEGNVEELQAAKLIAKTFVRNTQPKYFFEVWYLDNNPQNIEAENLIWVDRTHLRNLKNKLYWKNNGPTKHMSGIVNNDNDYLIYTPQYKFNLRQ